MITLKNADDVIDIFTEAGKPLDRDTIEDLLDGEKELLDLGLPSEIAVIELKCRICNFEQVALVPTVADLGNLECVNCEHMAAMEKETPDYI